VWRVWRLWAVFVSVSIDDKTVRAAVREIRRLSISTLVRSVVVVGAGERGVASGEGRRQAHHTSQQATIVVAHVAARPTLAPEVWCSEFGARMHNKNKS
jgi:hypothetical protein